MCWFIFQSRVRIGSFCFLPDLINLVRPDVKYFCDVDYDPFKFMEENKKVYGTHISNRISFIWLTESFFRIHNIAGGVGGNDTNFVEYRERFVAMQPSSNIVKLSWYITEFITENPQYVDPNNAMEFLSDNNGDTYNLCHCKTYPAVTFLFLSASTDWSNFEIADMDFWRGEAYQKFFDFLEAKGGFYYEACSFSMDNLII